ncbi:MAG: DnaA regulatory inactivator Hda [Legionellaceae bacterium]|nr:DnaA regulatory inactivator Hda [Legionellaceae bacterium]
MNHQLALAIQPNLEATFAEFGWGENTLLQQEITSSLSGAGERFIYIWGAAGSGKSHILQACCQHLLGQDKSSLYLPLDTLKTWDPAIIHDLDEHQLLCIDELDAITGNTAWEEALFHLYNRIRDAGTSTMIIASSRPPQHTPIALPDLRSRLTSCLVMQLHELKDTDKIQTLRAQARKRGFELPEPVAQYLVNRSARNMHDLHTLLDRLDRASLAAQRKITIPFVKTTLNW